MSSDDDRFWQEYAGRLQKRGRFAQLTPDEAAAAFDAAPIEPLSPERIDAIVEAATSGQELPVDPLWSETLDPAESVGQAYQLCRNQNDDGVPGPDEQALLDEVLGEDDNEEKEEGKDKGF